MIKAGATVEDDSHEEEMVEAMDVDDGDLIEEPAVAEQDWQEEVGGKAWPENQV